MAKESLPKFEDRDVVIDPQGLNNCSTFVLKDIDVIFGLGYKAVTKALKDGDLFKEPTESAVEFEILNGFFCWNIQKPLQPDVSHSPYKTPPLLLFP